MQVTFVLSQESIQAMTALDQVYRDGFKFLLSEWYVNLLKELQGRTPVDRTTTKGKAKAVSEHMQAQWELSAEMDGLGATFGNPAAYGPTLEEGKYPGIGPRTVAQGGGIYSRQAPGGIVKPLLDDPQVLQDNLDMVVKKLGDRLDMFLQRRA